jgi:hypothetical protein
MPAGFAAGTTFNQFLTSNTSPADLSGTGDPDVLVLEAASPN